MSCKLERACLGCVDCLPTAAEVFDSFFQNALNLYGRKLDAYDRTRLFTETQRAFSRATEHAKRVQDSAKA